MDRSDEHPHDHADAHPHDHPHAWTEAGEPPQGGPVVLDIGGDIGALVAYCDAAAIGTEIHVRRDGDTATTHTGVWARDLGANRVVVAVFPELRMGEYALLDARGATTRRLRIAGGAVTEVDLRDG